jgi:hypothetical protein
VTAVLTVGASVLPPVDVDAVSLLHAAAQTKNPAAKSTLGDDMRTAIIAGIAAACQPMLISVMSKSSVAFGGIKPPPAPAEPYARSGGMISRRCPPTRIPGMP